MTQSNAPSTSSSRDSRETAGQAAKDLGQDIRSGASDAVNRLKAQASEEANRRGEAAKSTAANEISDLGDALRKAADELQDGSPQARGLGQIAQSLADVSDTVRGKDLGEIVSDVTGFARRNPLAFIGGAALLGFAGTRLARASKEGGESSVDLSRYWGSEEEDAALDAEISRRPAAPSAATPPPTNPQPPVATTPQLQPTGEDK
ncbi:hypothetical protein [Poseidonocella sedimentorum]|uniref:DUF3618 domain-containing protein n=1 Tax=Poseidonocella sedimentorum TaxID=871652 RepID=A0A1I6E166_9RHOB|nr:hypothetical protein [Poseidonocella sedimentorum]SFR11435.1 hypothetical protein SAMN04515673_106203 [Poseidonocella sedimentorum]